ncbi:MAG TPA: hypothetical protein VII87_09650 [Solirubrobacteraceae bacterium]
MARWHRSGIAALLAATLLGAGLTAAAASAGTGIGTNGDGDFLDLTVAVSPPVASTAKVPQGVGLEISDFLGNRVNADSAVPMTSLDMFFRQGFTENGVLFPACTINTTTISRCPAASQIGSGSAETERLNPGGEVPTFGRASLRVYNGQPYLYGGSTLIFVFSRGGRGLAELDFAVHPQQGGLAINQILLPGAGPGTGITRFDVSIPDRQERLRVKGKTTIVHFFTAPTACTGGWTFGETTTSSGRRPLRASATQTCVTK